MSRERSKKLIIFIPASIIFLAGGVFGLNGYFGGGGTISSDTLTRGLVGYWAMDEGSGTLVSDASDYTNHGTLTYMSTSTNAWTSGKVGGALSFDGVDDYVGVPYGSSLIMGTNDFSVEAWFKIKLSDISDRKVYLLFQGSSGKRYYILVDGRFNNGWLQANIYDGITSVNWLHTNMADNQWHHLIVVWDRDGYVQGYVDGQAVGTPNDISGVGDITNTNGLWIGSDPTPGAYWQGSIDDVRVYNRALSASEVRYHYNRGGPVAQWKFDEGEGRTAYDSTDNNNDGTLVLAGSATSSAWVAGKYGGALSFDGTDDYVNVSNSISANTVSFWIKSSIGTDEILQLTASANIQISNNTITVTGFTSPTIYVNSQNTSSSTINTWSHVVVTTGTTITANAVKLGLVGSGYFNGLIDDVRIYNYARTPEEIRLDYNAGFAALFGPQTGCDQDPGSCMTQGLAGSWGFEEGSGTIAYDSSNYANNATTSGTAPSWTTGKVGGALQFDGTDDYARAQVPNFNINNVDTLELWFKTPSSISRGMLANLGTNLSCVSDVPPCPDELEWGTFGTPYIAFSNRSASWLVGTISLSLNTWYHIVAIHDSANNVVKTYINGILDINSSYSADLPTAAQQVDIAGTRIYRNGLIDEVRIYNRALTAEEVRYHYNRGGPVAQWSFDEGSGSVLYDKTESNNDGHLYLAPSENTATSSAWVAGKYGSALSFDGVDDYVKSNSNIGGASSTAYSLWFKSSDGVYSADEYLLSQGTNDPSIHISNANKVVVMADNATTTSSIMLVNDTKWHHVQITTDGTTSKLYLDGAFQSQASYTGSSVTGILYIASNATPGSYFGGIIDDVRIYNYARTPEEIRLDYNAGFAALFGPQTGCDQDPGSCMTNGLVGYWGMEDGSGTLASDASDYANHGTTSGGPQWTKGKVGGALSFDGTNDYVSISDNTTLDIVSNITIEGWINISSFSQRFSLLGKWASGVENYGIEVNETSKRAFFWNRTNNGFQQTADTGTQLNTGSWYYLAGVYDGSKLRMYVNGAEQATANQSGTPVTNNSDLFIGSLNATTQLGIGLIDEVRIYNRALSAEEIRYHYNRGAPVAQWKFDEGEGRTAYDSTDNNNDGTLVLAGSATSSAWVAGKYGGALNFDGTNDYVNAGSGTTLNITSAGSWGGWFKLAGGVGTYRGVLAKGTSGTDANNNYELWVNTANNIIAYIGNGVTNQSITATTQPAIGNWYHVIVTADGSNLKIYVNGVLEKAESQTITPVAVAQELDIGRVATNYFNGLIDDVRIYNYTRTPSQIQQDHNAGLSTHFK